MASGGLKRRLALAWEGGELAAQANRGGGAVGRPRRSPGGGGDGDEPEEVGLALLFYDGFVSVLWVWTSTLRELLVHNALDGGELLSWILYILSRYLFAWLGTLTGGGSFNPLIVFASSMPDGLPKFRAAVVLRILAQVIGSIIGVRQITKTFNGVDLGPQLQVGIFQGSLLEGLLTFMMIIIYLGLKETDPTFTTKIFISSFTRLALRKSGSNLTGGSMDPALAFGWAYARGDHMTKGHIFVYWIAPFSATLLAFWAFNQVTKTQNHRRY